MNTSWIRQRSTLVACLCSSVFWSSPRVARAEEPAAPEKERPSVGLSVFHAFSPTGFVKVREFQFEGDRLGLRENLGLRSVNALEADGRMPLGPRGALRILFQATLFGGDATLPRDEWFNGTLYQGGGHVDIGSTQYYRGLVLYQHRFVGTADPATGRVLGEAGLVLDALDFHIDGPLSPKTVKTEKRENFAKQLLPLPILGVTASQPLLRDVRAYGEFRVAFVRALPSFYKEGGTMHFTQTDLDAILGVAYRFDPVEAHLAYRQSFFYQETYSHEDTNQFRLLAQGFELGVAWSPR
ncbi:MAG TPA: hypothetical protein VHE30_01015 [Polyangiaceae bacterium]|nr:hypothetical protein [Polyangiaceae bacterium]